MNNYIKYNVILKQNFCWWTVEEQIMRELYYNPPEDFTVQSVDMTENTGGKYRNFKVHIRCKHISKRIAYVNYTACDKLFLENIVDDIREQFERLN